MIHLCTEHIVSIWRYFSISFRINIFLLIIFLYLFFLDGKKQNDTKKINENVQIIYIYILRTTIVIILIYANK